MLNKGEKYSLLNGILYKKENAENCEFSSCLSSFLEEGFIAAFENKMEGAEFVTLTKDDETVNLSLKGKKRTFRLVREKGINLPVSVSLPNRCDTLVTQVKTLFFSCDAGMSYIIRLCDGTFAVIDGGTASFDEAEHFLDLLNAQKITEDKPLIRAWFVTHPHLDHFGLFQKVMEKYKDEVMVENLVYNWPSPEFSDHWNDTARFDALAKNRDGFSVICARTGYKFSFGDTTFEILYSPDDAIPEKWGNVNDASVVIRQKTGDKTILYLGDIMTPGAGVLMEECAPDDLRAQIVQVAHHGFWGASDALYKIIDPEILFWPIPDYHYYNMARLPQNEYITHSEKIKDVFFASLEEVTLNLTNPAPLSHPYGKGSISYKADFSAKSMVTLGWSCIHKGYSPYRAPIGEFTENGLRVKTLPDAPMLIDAVAPPFMEGARKYKVLLEGKLYKGERFAFAYNYKNPKEICEEQYVPFCEKAGDFSYEIFCDEETRTLSVLKEGEPFATVPYTPDARHGIGFAADKADILFTKLIVESI